MKKNLFKLAVGSVAVLMLMSGCSTASISNTTAVEEEDDTQFQTVGTIDLSTMQITGKGVSVNSNIITITSGGDYTVTGTLTDGMIMVDTKKKVQLTLNGVDLTNTTGPAIYFANAKKAYINLADGSENTLTDSAEYSEDANGTIYSVSTLKVRGNGTLNVNGNYKHCIASDEKVSIESGTITLNSAVSDGIHAKDAVNVSGGNIEITALGDGIQSEGSINIADGTVNITTTGEVEESHGDMPPMGGGGGGGKPQGGDFDPNNAKEPNGEQPSDFNPQDFDPAQGGVQPDGNFDPDNMKEPEGERPTGDFNPGDMKEPDGERPTGDFNPGDTKEPDGEQPSEFDGKSSATAKDSDKESSDKESSDKEDSTEETTESLPSTKGIKAETDIKISGGTITVNSADHAIVSGATLTIDGGTLTLSSEHGKGIKSVGELNINDGTIDIQKSTEGIEGKGVLNFNGGDIKIVSSDDGINAGGGTDNMMMGGGDKDTDSDTNGKEHQINFNGGTIYVNAASDGIDSNGNLAFNGATVYVDGPENSGNGALDTNGTHTLTGGTLVACGSIGMAECPKSDSQNILNISFEEQQSAGSTVTVEDSTGNVILTYSPSKVYQSVIFSSADIKTGETYTVKVDGTELLSGTVENTVTSIGTNQSGFGGGGGNPGDRGQGGGGHGDRGQGGDKGQRPDSSQKSESNSESDTQTTTNVVNL